MLTSKSVKQRCLLVRGEPASDVYPIKIPLMGSKFTKPRGLRRTGRVNPVRVAVPGEHAVKQQRLDWGHAEIRIHIHEHESGIQFR